MRDLFFIACGSGTRDGLNPCIFMTSAVFVTYALWLKRTSLPRTRLLFIFAVAYALGILFFNFGSLQIFVLQKNFVSAAKVAYFVLGIWTLVSGFLFFKDWFLLSRGILVKNETGEKIKLSLAGEVLIILTGIIGPLVLSILATLWPMDKYIFLLGNIGIMKGQWRAIMPVLAAYTFVSMWALWLVWMFISIKDLRPSLFKIVCSSVYFTASSCMIFIFK